MVRNRHEDATSWPASADDAASTIGDPFGTRSGSDRFQSAGAFEQALASWRQVLEDYPGDVQAIAGMANALLALGRTNEALPLVWQVLDAALFHPPSQIRLGKSLIEADRCAEAVEVLASVLEERPHEATAWNFLGIAQHRAGRHGAALASFRRASDLQPAAAAPHINLAQTYVSLNRLPEALDAGERALTLKPRSPVASFNMGCTLLAMGRMREGWDRYRSRRDLYPVPMHPTTAEWAGDDPFGRRVLVLGEQGNGDVIQFARYVSALAELGASVTFVTPRRLHRLLSTLPGEIILSETMVESDPFDVQCLLMDLPHHIRMPDAGSIDWGPYLSAEPERIARWTERIGHQGFRIGVAWQGQRYRGADFHRAFPLEMLRPLADVPGVRLISLQSGDGVEQVARLPPGMRVEMLDDTFDAGQHGFLDAAAVMQCVDLVITLDSALAHLSGALGRPTWIALNHAPEWRWQRERTDSPWYPSARLFRQHLPGDWDVVFTRMAQDLSRRVPMHGSTHTPPSVSRTLPMVPATWGEIFDKISILEIKRNTRVSPEAIAKVDLELLHLRSAADRLGTSGVMLAEALEALRVLNQTLWTVEDASRACERDGRFDSGFVSLARQVYRLNDERARLKRVIDQESGSEIVEQKIYNDTPTC